MIVAIIPARGGSKRIPHKNIKLFAGRPIISYSIEAALNTRLFDKVLVSTDSDEIKQVALKYGADVPFMRPESLSADTTDTDDVILHALHWLMDKSRKVDYACCIYATAPLLRVEYIRLGFELLLEYKATSSFSVTSFPSSIYRAFKVNEKRRIEMIWPEYLKTRSQRLPEVYYDAGQFYWVNVEKYLEEMLLFSSDAIPIIIPRYLVQDIDTSEDWETAEKMYSVLKMDTTK